MKRVEPNKITTPTGRWLMKLLRAVPRGMTLTEEQRRVADVVEKVLPKIEAEAREDTVGSSGKVYVIEVGAYSDRYIDAIFTTRGLAEACVLNRQRRAFGGTKAHRRVTMVTFVEGRPVERTPHVPDDTFEAFLKRHSPTEFGSIEEFDLRAVLPVVPG